MNIVSIVKVSTQGISRPYVCLGDDGEIYWCKGNHTGLRALMLEWICARIAHAVSLPVPACHIARLPYGLFASWKSDNGDAYPSLVTVANQYVFASRNVEASKDVIDIARDLQDVDPALLSKVYVFDRFIRNTDRTDVNSNLLINGGMHVIDHNNAMDRDFDEVEFSQTHILRGFFARMHELDMERFASELHSVVTPEFLESVWSEMPSEWTEPCESVLALEDIKRMLTGRSR